MKKDYINPETQVVMLSQQASLLAGSNYQLYDDPTEEINDESGVI